MRYCWSCLLMLSLFTAVYGADFTLLDASGGMWDCSGLFRQMLDKQSAVLPEKYSFTLTQCTEFPQKLSAEQAALVCGSPEKWKRSDFNYHLLGWIAVVAAAGSDCPVKDISIENLRRIYSGRAAEWSRFGGGNVPIKRGGCSEKNPLGVLFAQKVMNPQAGGDKTDLNSQIAPGMVVCSSSQACRTLVQAVPGMIVFGSVDLLQFKGANFNILKINGVFPDEENIASGRYPLAIPVGMLSSRNAPVDVIKKIVTFLQAGFRQQGGMGAGMAEK